MKKCRQCDRETYTHYHDYHVTIAPRPNVWIRDAKVYVCPNCGEQGLAIQSLAGFNTEVLRLPEDNPTPVYFAVDHMGTWFRLPKKGW